MASPRTLISHIQRLFVARSALFTSVLLALLFFLAAKPASARQLQIEKFSSEIFVQSDAALDVTEKIDAYFIGSFNGLYRTIPVEYVTPQGFNYTLFVKLQSATDDMGQPLRVESSREGHYLKWKIYVPGAEDVHRTIVLHYRVNNGLKFFEDHDELYWNVTGDEWDVPIANASADIMLPTGVTNVRALEFTGSYGATGHDADVETAGNRVTVTMQRKLAFHEGLTVVIGWDKGFVSQPGNGQLIQEFLISNWPLFIPVFVFVVMFWLWYTRGRDPRIGPIAVQYEPPDGLSPAEAGTLVDDDAAMRDITATIVDMAVRGYLTIEEKDNSHMMGLIGNKEFTFHLKKQPSEWTGLKPHEILLLSGIFSNGAAQAVELSELQNHFYTNIPPIKDGIFEQLMKRGYFLHRPDVVRSSFVGGAALVVFLMILIGTKLAQSMGMVAAPFVTAGILSGIIIAGFGWFMPTRTEAGMKALAGVLGFENFMTHVETDRMERVGQTPATFEKFLPYAMALGVEKKWVGAFKDIYTTPPSWYQGGYYGGGFQTLIFVNSLQTMTARAGMVMASAPRSSGGSGFGGGGSSGAGFGGGGGGGF